MATTIRATLPLTYTFTGNDRGSSVTASADSLLTFVNTGSKLSTDPNPMLGGGSVRIVGARVLPTGAEGLSAPEALPAAALKMSVGGERFDINVTRYGEWDRKDFTVHGSSEGVEIEAGSVVNIDDYNLQDAFVGESVTFVLELMVESVGR